MVRIGNKKIGPNYPTFIIAEAGVNHNGNFKLAMKMIDAAKKAGADAIKFQTFKAENLVTFDAEKAEYQKSTDRAKSQFEMLKNLELSDEEFFKLKKYCDRKKIIFISSPFDMQSFKILKNIGLSAVKVASGEITNFPFLESAAKTKKPILLSTGMSKIFEIKEAVKFIQKYNSKIILLHCITNYPTEDIDANLNVIDAFSKNFNCIIGYSDHTKGILAPVAAVSKGVKVIEKHFTLDKKLEGPDHSSSLEPSELQEMIQNIRIIELMLGNGIRKPNKNEKNVSKVARKSIIAHKDIKKGKIIKKSDVIIKRPGTGIEPKYLSKIIGKKARKNIKKDKMIRKSDII